MNILQVSPGYLPAIGGVEEHVRNISERLAAGHEVTVFTADPSGKLPREEKVNGVLVKRFNSFSPGNAYHISLDMLKELRQAKFEIVHGHNYHAFPLFFSRYAQKRRFIVTPHYHGQGATLTRNTLLRMYKPLGKKIFREAHNVIAVSNYERGLVLKDFKIDADKIITIPNGLELAKFKKLKRASKDRQTILYVGRLEEYKGVQYTIRALPLLNENIRLEIVGSGPYKESLLGLARKLGAEHRVDFYQSLSQDELLHRYAEADIFVQLSRYEAYGITVAEALAAGTPCIVADATALSEWIDNKNCAGINYPIDINTLVKLINESIGRDVYDIKLWDWDEVTAELLKIYSGEL